MIESRRLPGHGVLRRDVSDCESNSGDLPLRNAAVVGSALVLSALAVLPASAQEVPGFYRSVQRGHTVRVIGFFEVDPTCRSAGRTTINLLTPPRGGRLAMEDGTVFPKFPASNVRATCNRRRVPATNIYYTASPDFVGDDSFTVETVSPSGRASQSRWSVHVD